MPDGVTQYIRLFSAWGGTKLDRLRAAGYEVVGPRRGRREGSLGCGRPRRASRRRRLAVARAARGRARDPLAGARARVDVPDRRRPARRARRPRARRPRRSNRRTRPRGRRTSTRSARARRAALLYAVGPGRAPSSEVAHWSMLGYRPEEFPGRAVFEAVGRGQDVDPAARVRLRRAASGRATRRRLVADGATGSRSRRRRGRAPGRALRGDRGRRADLLARARLARRGRAARVGRGRPARDRQRRVLPRSSPRAPATAARARGGAHGTRGGGVDARGDAPPRRASAST